MSLKFKVILSGNLAPTLFLNRGKCFAIDVVLKSDFKSGWLNNADNDSELRTTVPISDLAIWLAMQEADAADTATYENSFFIFWSV
jgi:hypothetical protein